VYSTNMGVRYSTLKNNNNIHARAQLRDNLYWISNMVAIPVAENATTVSNKNMSDDVTM
jgi:hypothetical protein